MEQRGSSETSNSWLIWVGYVAVPMALASALVTFLILAGATPIPPTNSIVQWVFILNGILILLLLGIVAWQSQKLIRARMEGAAAAGLHVRIVGLFTLVAGVPAILIAGAASV